MGNDSELDKTVMSLCEKSLKNSGFDVMEYSRYQVKQGLRNADGTGVIAGLTRLCNVHGYVLNEGERAPVDGRLVYRGYDLDDIVNGFISENRFGFEEAVYLLLTGELPDAAELAEFHAMLAMEGELPKNFIHDIIMRSPSDNIMNILARSVLALYSYDSRAEDQTIENVMRQSVKLIATLPKMMVAAYESKLYAIDNKNMHFYKPDANRSLAENILLMLRSDQRYTENEARLLDLCMVLHADHGGGNNSSFAVRTLTSALTDTYSAIAAGIGSLKGFRHGGANRKVTDMLDNIKCNVKDPDDKDEIQTVLEKIVHREAGDGTGLIYGIGHAVYTLSDPRARMLKSRLAGLAIGTEHESEFKIACHVEELAPQVLRRNKGNSINLCANVDLYSGITYRTLGIPDELFTPMFCISRVAGWCAHRIEELTTPGSKIIRPAYKPAQPEMGYAPLASR
jgi:citrate synthase